MRVIASTALALVTVGLSVALAQESTDFALRLNGVSDFIATAERLPTFNTFTIDAWVRPTAPHEIDTESQSGYAGIEGQRFAVYPSHGTHVWGRGHAGVGFSVGTNGISVYEHAGCYLPAVLVYEAPIRGWTHVAVVYSDRVPSLYVDGRLVRTGVRSVKSFVHPSTGDNHPGRMIGGIGGGAYGYFEGELDDVRIWGQALNASDIRRAATGSLHSGGALVSFDMNRAGAGAGLVVANVTHAATTVSKAQTFGTALTPLFTRRGEGVSQQSPQVSPESSTPLDPGADRRRLDPRSVPVLR